MSSSRYLEDCLSRRVIFFAGKGGVGKTTLAWATAIACAQRSKPVTLVGLSPFDTTKSPPMENHPDITWLTIEPVEAFREYTLRILKFDRVYQLVFDNRVFKTFIRAAPGMAETVVAGKVWDLYARAPNHLILVDLPSTGHALSFFQSPLGVKTLFAAGFVHKETLKILEMFSEPTTRIDIVTLPEELAVLESTQFKRKLQSLLPVTFGYVHLNQTVPALGDLNSIPQQPALDTIRKRYEEEKRRDREAEDELKALELPMIKFPRIGNTTWRETVEALANQLGQS